MPIIEMQRALVEVGRIRSGEKGAKGEPRKLDKWRLTSRDKARLDAAADKWGGEVREWEGQWELYTDTAELPIMLPPESEATLWFEQWSRGGCQRRCDGVTEMLSDSPCLCGEERECKPTLRFSVLLPDIPGLGRWLVQSHGFNAAREIPGAIELLSRVTAQGVLLPARLRLEQRQEIKNGQTRKFAVPVIDLDVSFRDLLGAQGALSTPSETRALPAGYVPIAPAAGNGMTLAQGLTEAERVSQPGRSAPIPDADVDLDPSPVAVQESEALPPPPASPSADPKGGASASLKPTKRQGDKLNVLVGKLREAGLITTQQLYSALAKSRNVDAETMIGVLAGARDEAGDLHWTPLRESLTRHEASDLIDRLSKLEENAKATA